MRRAVLGRAVPRAAALLSVIAVFGVLAAPAVAAHSSTRRASATASPTTTSGAGETPASTGGTLRLYVEGAFSVHRQLVSVAGRPVRVAGIVTPYVPGQTVQVRVTLGGRVIHSGVYRLMASRHLLYGAFTVTVRSPGTGAVQVAVTHAATTAMGAFAGSRGFTVLSVNVGFGSTGRFVELIQQRLAALHFYIPQTGVYDTGTGLALDAYHRLLRWGTYQTLDSRTISYLLNGRGAFPVHYPGDGHHAEGDLSLQLLALIDGRKVVAIYPISSGKPSTPTILGRFHVYSKVPGYLPDGMYYSNFFYSGYAVHGYDPAPDYPASHGCMRLPIVDAISVYDWLQIGDAVDTYY